MYEKAVELFDSYVGDMVVNGWSAKKVVPNTYILKDSEGSVTVVSCHIEGDLTQRVSVFMRIDDSLAPIGTLLLTSDGWQVFPLHHGVDNG